MAGICVINNGRDPAEMAMSRHIFSLWQKMLGYVCFRLSGLPEWHRLPIQLAADSVSNSATAFAHTTFPILTIFRHVLWGPITAWLYHLPVSLLNDCREPFPDAGQHVLLCLVQLVDFYFKKYIFIFLSEMIIRPGDQTGKSEGKKLGRL